MSTTQFDSRRKPRQLPSPIFPNFRVPNANAVPETPASTGTPAGFFTPSGAAPAAPSVTLTASTAGPAVAEPTPEPEVIDIEEAEVEALPSTAPVAVDVGEPATPLVTASAVASGTEGMPVEEQNAALTTSPGGIAMGSIAGVAFLVSIMFLLYKWRRGTLPQSLQRAARAIKFRSSKPAPEADSMEKGLTSDAASIRSESASIHSVSSLKSTFSVSTIRSTVATLKRSVSVASSRAGDRGISGPEAFEGQQADKLAVPPALHLARLEAAGLWTADPVRHKENVAEGLPAAAAGTADEGKMDPNPVVEEPDVHPLRAHRVQPEGDKQVSWPLSS